jgi:hypothetical protein
MELRTVLKTPVGGLASALLGYMTALLANGLVPFITLPTMGQLVWASAYAQSIANQSLLALSSNNFGLPAHAPIAFGAAAVYPMAALIKVGLIPGDAYTLVFTAFVGLAFFGCMRISTHLGLTVSKASLLATAWLTMPVVWGHSGYSMLSLGFALLPAYIACSLFLLDAVEQKHCLPWRRVATYVGACLLAAFMDGYTFVMFAVASAMLTAGRIISQAQFRKLHLSRSVPGQVLSILAAYLAYRAYARNLVMWNAPLEAFRGWGVDLSFLVLPSAGTSWIPDILHWSVRRSTEQWYGDVSVWETTFLLPILVAAVVAVVRTAGRTRDIATFAFLALIALYLSLGPSVKAWSEKPTSTSIDASMDSHYMPSTAARFPTGSGALSAHIPGFSSMRASYRWLGLAAAACWLCLICLHVAGRSRKGGLIGVVITIAVIAVNFPHVGEQVRNGIAFRRMYMSMEKSVMTSYRALAAPGETAAFLPYGNDFLIGYIVARAKGHTFNVGGDKNLALAISEWPDAMARVPQNELPADLADRSLQLLLEGDAQVIIVPYFLEPMAAHVWPCVAQAPVELSAHILGSFGSWLCPTQRHEQFAPILAGIARDKRFIVTDGPLMASIRLSNEMRSADSRAEILAGIITAKSKYPVDLSQPQAALHWMFSDGWADKESKYIWSSKKARLELPVPSACHGLPCEIVFRFWSYPGALGRRSTVEFHDTSGTAASQASVQVRDGAVQELALPVTASSPIARINVTVPGATSPYAEGRGPDGRTLGIALEQIEWRTVPPSAPLR